MATIITSKNPYIYEHPVYGTFKLHFNHWLPQLLNIYAICPDGKNIYIHTNQINEEDLAHEIFHAIQRRKRSIMFVPWVLSKYAFGYAGSKPEVEADNFAHESWYKFDFIIFDPYYVRAE